MPKTAQSCTGSLKFLFAFFIFLCFGFSLQAQAIRGLEPLGLVHTEHFEIYHSLGTTDQALRLSTFADATLADIEAIFGTFAPPGKIPVLVTDVQPELNGYAVPYPSNRIVLFLAEPDLRDSLATFDDELRMVFTHELVHLVNMNERSPFWKFVAALVGDVASPSAWTLPYALLEGTAVWMESRITTEAGRLNDPAALEIVRLDLSHGLERSVWDVSGVLEYPGSGYLPYVYGGLFVEYFVERFGVEALSDVWKISGKGNIFKGFDSDTGIAENVSGIEFNVLWNDFLVWARPRLGVVPLTTSKDRLLLSGLFGPLASDGKNIYYLDHSRKAVYSLRLLPEPEQEGSKPRPELLFAADYFLTAISLGREGKALDLDWISIDSAGSRKPEHYTYGLDDRKLRTTEQNAVSANPASPGWKYELQRIGSSVVPSRVSHEGLREYIEFTDGSLRSIHAAGQGLVALSFTSSGNASRIAVLRQDAEKWELLVQKSPPPGGAHSPAFAGPENIAYIAWLPAGRQELRLFDFTEALESDQFAAREIVWKPFPPTENKAPIIEKPLQKTISALFPRALSSVRYPYIGPKSAGLIALGSDLTERLSWEAHAGWEFDSKIPESSLEIRLDTSGHRLNLAMSDSSVPSSGGFARVSGASLGWGYQRILLPVQKRAGMNAYGSASGVKDSYSLSQLLHPSWDHSSLAGGLSLYYSDMAFDSFAPFDSRGFSVRAVGEFEHLPQIAQALSISGVLSLASAKPGLKFSLYGAYSPLGGVLFLPSGRYFRISGYSYGSAIPIRYPYFDEYSAISTGSPWYGYAELSARILSFETGQKMKPVHIPLLPPWTLRRFSLVAGTRMAAMELSSTPIFPASGFFRLESDFAFLVGLASQTHFAASVEAALAFDKTLAGGNPLFINFGLGAWY